MPLQESVFRTSGFGGRGIAMPSADVGKPRLVGDMGESCCRYSELSVSRLAMSQVVRNTRLALEKTQLGNLGMGSAP